MAYVKRAHDMERRRFAGFRAPFAGSKAAATCCMWVARATRPRRRATGPAESLIQPSARGFHDVFSGSDRAAANPGERVRPARGVRRPAKHFPACFPSPANHSPSLPVPLGESPTVTGPDGIGMLPAEAGHRHEISGLIPAQTRFNCIVTEIKELSLIKLN
jgi:hypothetical protein